MVARHALLDARQMTAADAAAIRSGTDGFELMRRAGEALADAAARELAAAGGGPVTVCAGPGNNGGDGAVVAALMAAGGADVALVRVGGARAGSDAARAFGAWTGPTLETSGGAERVGSSALAVDALLGAGLSRAPDGDFAALIGAMNGSGARTLAADLPSGLDGNAHVAPGPVVRADATVTFVRYKPAHLLEPGRSLCGRLELADIGMPDAALDGLGVDAWANVPALWRASIRPPAVGGHKFGRGHVLVRAGGPSTGGAARLAASAALGCGAGLVTLACPGSATLVNAAHLDAVMLARADDVDAWRALLGDARVGTLLLGPGNGSDAATADAVIASLGAGRDCVLDADALTAHAAEPTALFDAIRAASGSAVLTPHEGEFARLFGTAEAAGAVGGPSKLHRARAAARLSGATVVLKGPDTVVAAPDGRASVGVNAPPWLATAGSGDVLAGTVAALLAQGTPAFEAASAAVWLHGDAGARLGWPTTAEALAPAVGDALRRLGLARARALPGGLDLGPDA